MRTKIYNQSSDGLIVFENKIQNPPSIFNFEFYFPPELGGRGASLLQLIQN
jgi:hypothetical protein